VKPEEDRRDIRSHVGAPGYQADRRNPGATTEVLPAADRCGLSTPLGTIPAPLYCLPMARPRRNPFYAVLGIVGFLFTITAVSYCLAVLRIVRPTGAATASMSHPLQALMDRHGGGILAAELVVLAIATVGAVWLDHVEGERIRQARLAAGRRTAPDGADSEAGAP